MTDACDLFAVYCHLALTMADDAAFALAVVLTADCPIPAGVKRLVGPELIWWLGVVQARERRATENDNALATAA